jgi:anti-sigma factor RsiW
MSNHRCDEFVELVTAYLEDTLDAETRAAVDADLEVCDGCARYLDQVRRTVETLGTLPEESLPADARAAILRAFGQPAD